MNIPVSPLTDLKMMAAMRIAADGRMLARVTAELPRAQVTGEYLAGFACSLGPLERDRAAREIDLDLRDKGQTRTYVVCEATDQHRDLLLSYEVTWYNDHAKVGFTLTSATRRPSTTSAPSGCNEQPTTDRTNHHELHR